MLSTVKAFARVTDDSDDALIEIVIAEVTAAVLAYTRRCALDEDLTYITAHIAADVYRALDTSNVTMISEGDRRVEYAIGITTGGYISAYANILDAFRDRKGLVPSDV